MPGWTKRSPCAPSSPIASILIAARHGQVAGRITLAIEATGLLLGGGAPTPTLESGALAALADNEVRFDVISTAGAGMLIGLLSTLFDIGYEAGQKFFERHKEILQPPAEAA